MNHSFPNRRSTGASLIELLVAVAIIGVLIGLLIPAIQAVRNAAKKTQNQNNMRQIILAFQNYANQNDGNIPQPVSGSYTPWTNWLGMFCNPYGSPKSQINPYNSTYSYQNGKQTAVSNSCYNPGIKSASCTYDSARGRWVDCTVVENQTGARTDWVDGNPYFRLLPYLGYDAVFHASFGPMRDGDKYRYWNDNTSSCKCPSNSEVDYYGNPWCPGQMICQPGFWVHVDDSYTSQYNQGYQAGRAVGSVKTYVAYGDPTSDDPNLLAPLSYPLFGPFPNKLEQYNTSYQPFITEAYSGCAVASNYTYPGTVAGGYLSWASSSWHDLDATTGNNSYSDAATTPGYGYIASSNPVQYGQKQVWMNHPTPSALVGTYKWVTTFGYSYKQFVVDKPATQALKAKYAPQNVVDPYGKPIPQYSMYQAWSQTCDDWRTTNQPKHTQHSKDKDAYECHCLDWFYYYQYPIYTRQFFLDHPKVSSGCTLGMPMSMVPGSLNIGLLDGSVKSVSTSIDTPAWNALMSGQGGGTTDPGDW